MPSSADPHSRSAGSTCGEAAPEGPQAFSALLGRLLGCALLFIQSEAVLVKVEMRKKAGDTAMDAGILAGAIFTFAVGVLMLLLALAALLGWLLYAMGMGAAAACFTALGLTALLALGAGLSLAIWGIRRLKSRRFLPEKSFQNIKKNTRCIIQTL